jgi:hypothetical protein
MQLRLYTYKFCTEDLGVILCIYVRLLTIYLQEKKVGTNYIHNIITSPYYLPTKLLERTVGMLQMVEL